MEGTKYTTKEAVLKRGQEAIGIPLKDIDKTGRISTGKGYAEVDILQRSEARTTSQT